jgi:hypothetical protein
MLSAALSLPLLALRPRRAARTQTAEREQVKAHDCKGQMRVRTVTEDGREVWACPCVAARIGSLSAAVPGAASRRQKAAATPEGDGGSRYNGGQVT